MAANEQIIDEGTELRKGDKFMLRGLTYRIYRILSYGVRASDGQHMQNIGFRTLIEKQVVLLKSKVETEDKHAQET
jgi:hypothetical protein